jgi:hypothetical protein
LIPFIVTPVTVNTCLLEKFPKLGASSSICYDAKTTRSGYRSKRGFAKGDAPMIYLDVNGGAKAGHFSGGIKLSWTV